MTSSTLLELYKLALEEVDKGELSHGDLEQFYRKVKREINKQTLTNKVYITKEQAKSIYCDMLDNVKSTNQAMQEFAESQGLDKEWIEEVKHNNYLHSKEVVTMHTNHPIQKAMVKNGTFKKSLLVNANTPSKQFNELYRERLLHETLVSAQADNEVMKSEIEKLNALNGIQDVTLDDILEAIGKHKLTPKEKAGIMKRNNIKQKIISEVLSIPIRTLKTWWPNL